MSLELYTEPHRGGSREKDPGGAPPAPPRRGRLRIYTKAAHNRRDQLSPNLADALFGTDGPASSIRTSASVALRVSAPVGPPWRQKISQEAIRKSSDFVHAVPASSCRHHGGVIHAIKHEVLKMRYATSSLMFYPIPFRLTGSMLTLRHRRLLFPSLAVQCSRLPRRGRPVLDRVDLWKRMVRLRFK